MKVFVTGATGFIGKHVVKELLGAGHQVLGMTRSEQGAAALVAAGAQPHHGTLTDLDSLQRGAKTADAVIHLAFDHDFSRFVENCETDRKAIQAIGAVLSKTDKPLIVTGGVARIGGPGQLVTEDMAIPVNSQLPRASEQAALALIEQGVRASVMRLPQVHDTEKQGLVTFLIAHARERNLSGYVGDGQNRWAAAHVSDVARLYRLALENNHAGQRYHAVAEEGVSMKEIAEAIGRGLRLPVASISPDKSEQHFGWLTMFAAHDLAASSVVTRKSFGWNPGGPGLIEDLNNMKYF